MEQIDDYIEPLLEIQKISKELHKMLLHKRYEEAYIKAGELRTQSDLLQSWCYTAKLWMFARRARARTRSARATTASKGEIKSMSEFNATKIDDCCYQIKVDGEYVGVWCPESHILATDGDFCGFADSLDDLENRLEKIPVMVWSLKDD